MSLPKSAAIVVVGGGVIGASVAHHLAVLGARDVVVLERHGEPGRGSTGAATGGYRAQYGTAINVRLSLLARAKILAFEEETGVDPGYLLAGYLWLARSESAYAALREGNRMQVAEGLTDARLVAPAEIAQLNPWIDLDGVIGGTFGASDGFVKPLCLLEGYRRAASRNGVRFHDGPNAEVVGMTRRGDSGDATTITSVTCRGGSIACDMVVNAAGAWARGIAAMAGVDLPVEPLRRQALPTMPTHAVPENMPMTIWADDGYHLRVRDGRCLLLWPSLGAPDPFDVSVDPAWMDIVEETTRHRVPALRAVEVDRAGAWAGLYEISPDKHAILGRAAHCGNLYLANGSSGHGVMHAPALGALLAEIMLRGKAESLDATALRPSRFEEGAPIEGPALL